MNSQSLEKLCSIAVAAGVIGAHALGTTVAPGVLEAATGAGGFLLGRRQGREADFRRVLDGVKRDVERGYRAWIEAEHGGKEQFHKANLDNAVVELERVIDRCVPDPSDMVGVDLNGACLADLMLERAAQHSQAFREGSDNPVVREVFRTIIIGTYERIRTNSEYLATLRTYVDEELLARTGRTEAVVTRTETKVDAAHAKLDALLEKVSADKGVPLPVLQEILARLGEQNVPLDAAVIEARLRAKADEYHDLTARLRRLAGDDERVQELRREAAALIDQGDFDSADARLAEAEARDLEVAKEILALAERRLASAAESRAERGAAARLRLSYKAAAAHYAEAAATVPAGDLATWLHYLFEQAVCLISQGEEFGDNGAFLEAIEVYRRALTSVPRAQHPLAWAAIQNNLGRALARMGERLGSLEWLEQAATAYRAALEERTRERDPLEWAMTQQNLGSVLIVAWRYKGQPDYLKGAIAAYRAALEERTRKRAPLQWAMTQGNLGIALHQLGEREGSPEWWGQATAAFQAALLEYTRERMPLEWASMQTYLGCTFASLGQHQQRPDLLKQGVAALRMALEVRTRDRVPLDWAMTQHNLGSALVRLGESEIKLGESRTGRERLIEAVAVLRAALEERTRERMPLDWAMTRFGLGAALASLGSLERRRELLEQAIAAFQAALLELTPERAPQMHAAVRRCLFMALMHSGALIEQ